MSVNRALFANRFTTIPRWPCPTCLQGHLIKKQGCFHAIETGGSKRSQSHEDWGPDWITKRFSGILVCDNDACGELAAILGTADVIEVETDPIGAPSEYDWVDRYCVRSILPAPWPIVPPQGTPPLVREALEDAARLLWQSSEAAANQVRQAVEHLMDSRGIKKRVKGIDKKGNPITTRLVLHNRIELFGKQDAANADILLAVKWLGNSGSHAGGLKRVDVFDAFDMMEKVLNKLYGGDKALMKRVTQVNRNKGA